MSQTLEQEFAQYAAIKSILAKLEEEASKVKKSIEEKMLDGGMDKVPSVFGEFALRARKTWKYPANVTRLEEEVKVAKFEAENKGTATFTENSSLYFTPTKI